jgi:predicted ArsR family transcriptional regulator
MLELTTRQHEYILELSEGAKTIQEIARIVGISSANVSKRFAELQEMGIVKSSWITSAGRRLYMHELIRSYEELVLRGFVVKNYNRKKIALEEIYYAAILTNAGMTGIQKTEQYQKVYPDRTRFSLKNITTLAKRMHLCR